jgi:uncharacterized protein (TIGR03643 family)
MNRKWLQHKFGKHLLKFKPFSLLQSLKIMREIKELSDLEIDRIVEMAWEDRTPFDAIYCQFGITESQTIDLMRRNMKASSFRMWRERVQGRATKHRKKSPEGVVTFKSDSQRTISQNKISKR